MTPDLATVAVAICTVLAAIAAGYFGQRAAGKTAQPNAQDAINAGFTALTARQVEELTTLRTDVDALKDTNRQQARQIRELESTKDEQHREIQELQEHVERQDDLERRYRTALTRLLTHLNNLRQMLMDAGLPVPPDPVDFREINALLEEQTDKPKNPPR